MTVKNIYGMDLKQTRRYGSEQSGRIETGLKAGNLVCFIPRGNRSFDKYRALNHNKELSTRVCRNFDAFWFWNHHKSVKSHCLRKPGRVERWGSADFLQINTI